MNSSLYFRKGMIKIYASSRDKSDASKMGAKFTFMHRFARNTVDSLSTIRKLKDHNIECYFEKRKTSGYLTARVSCFLR